MAIWGPKGIGDKSHPRMGGIDNVRGIEYLT